MILSTRALPVVLPFLLLGLVASASEDNHVRSVVKTDGTIGQYQLLPVHYDPAHASVVKNRLALSSLRDGGNQLPGQYSIPSSALPVVRDQGQRGTCAYFATVGILEAYYMGQSPNYSSLTVSEECLVDVRNWEFDQAAAYTGTDKPTQRPDPNGDLPASIIQTVTTYGVPASAKYGATDCTYNGTNQNGADVSLTDYEATFTGSDASYAFGKGLTFDQNSAPTIDTVRGLIASGVPVEVGIIVYNEYMYNGPDWRYDPKVDTDDNIAGGHAVILTGYTTTNGKTIFTFKNSWGPTWGNSGYGTIDDGILTKAWSYDPSFDFITSVHG